MAYHLFDADPWRAQVWLDRNDDGIGLCRSFRGKRLASGWRPPRVGLNSRASLDCDFFMFYANAPVVNDNVVRCLTPLVGDAVEFLPLEGAAVDFFPGGRLEIPTSPLYVMNVVDVVDALDEERSRLVRAPDGRLSYAEKYVFRDGAIGGRPIFKQRGLHTDHIFVSDSFKRVVEESGLTSARFRAAEENPWPRYDPPEPLFTGMHRLAAPEEDPRFPLVQATEDQIARIEARVGLPFPDTLRWMFAHANGYDILDADEDAWVQCETLRDSGTSVERHYEFYSLHWGIAPRSWFPFAEDATGHPYLVDCLCEGSPVYYFLANSDPPNIASAGVSLDQFLGLEK